MRTDFKNNFGLAPARLPARTPPHSPARIAAGRWAPPLPRRAPRLSRGALPERGVFEDVAHRLSLQAPEAGSTGAGWAPRLRSALARYHRARQVFAEQPGKVSAWRDVRDALAVLERMSASDRVPPAMREAMDGDALWMAFRSARGLCQVELRQLQPQAHVPPAEAVQLLYEGLGRLRRSHWPEFVAAWAARLQENLDVYLMSEADHRRGSISAELVGSAIEVVLGGLLPPSSEAAAGPQVTPKLTTWQRECRKPLFQARLTNCRHVLALRQAELARSANHKNDSPGVPSGP